MKSNTSSLRSGLVSALAGGALLAGCAVGPDYHRPESAATAYLPAPVEAAMRDERQVVDADLPAQWWTLFHSPALDELVRGALARSPSVTAAQAALRQATELRRAQQASFFPTVDASYSASRQKVARPLASPLASNADLFNLSTAQVSVSYTPDLFGLNRRQVESLQAQEQAQRWNVEATYLTLSANLVVAVISEASLHAQFEATTRQIALQSEVLARFRELKRLGENSELDVAQQESQLAALQATLPGLYKQMVQQGDLVKALAGLPPTASVPEPRLDDLSLPDPLPLTLPSTLVEHRPDVLAAEAQLQGASADIGVAVANRLPQVTLGVNTWGSSAASLSGLFAPGTSFWTLAGRRGAAAVRRRGAQAQGGRGAGGLRPGRGDVSRHDHQRLPERRRRAAGGAGRRRGRTRDASRARSRGSHVGYRAAPARTRRHQRAGREPGRTIAPAGARRPCPGASAAAAGRRRAAAVAWRRLVEPRTCRRRALNAP